MAFSGWRQVAQNLRAIAIATDVKLNDGQRDSLRALSDRIHEHGMIVADEVGMGKTRIAVALARAVVDAGGRVAILIPPTIGFQWQEELRLGNVPDVPDAIRSLLGFLSAWSDPASPKPWFVKPVLLISHGFVNWRLGATTRRWRFELLPLLVGHAEYALSGAYPHGFRAMSDRADPWARTAAQSIVDFCTISPEAALKARFDELGAGGVWRETVDGASYEQGSRSRLLLQSAVGLGLGAFDLVVVDEAHKSRNEDTGLSRLLERTLVPAQETRRLCMTATPVELSSGDWDLTLTRIKIDDQKREQIKKTVIEYGEAARRARLGWRGSEAARNAYVSAAIAFEIALKPYVLRRDKRGDASVIEFQKACLNRNEPGGYRWQHDISISPGKLHPDWRRAVCAAEALSFVASGRDDPALQRLRLTFANGHGVATRLDASAASREDTTIQADDPSVQGDKLGLADSAPEPGSHTKRIARADWWQKVIDRVARTESALYEHPSLRAAVEAIEAYDAQNEKVLVFGKFTRPMRALVELLNARAMLRALDAGAPWPQSQIGKAEENVVAAAHRQLGRQGFFDLSHTNAQLKRQYSRIERRREILRASLFDLILRGLPETEQDARALAEAAKTGSDESRAVLSAAIDQLLGSLGTTPTDAPLTGLGSAFSQEAVATAFMQLLAALRERGEGDTDGNEGLDTVEANKLWQILSDRLAEEYGTERGRFARLMNGATSHPTRRTLQLAFNRSESNPRVLVAQSLVGREGLNLHQACRIVILLHPEWNPGVVEQQIGRVDRVGSHWARMLESTIAADTYPLPRIEIRPVIFEGTYDSHHWKVLNERWDDLRAHLHGVVVPPRSRSDCTEDEMKELARLDAAAPNFEPP